MKAKLLYVTDPYCVWCYGFSRVVARAARDYADRIDARIINGGMIPSDTTFSTMFGRFPDLMARRIDIGATAPMWRLLSAF